MSDLKHTCPLCERAVPKLTAHHLVPKSRGGRVTLDICADCHGMIHALFQNKSLERELNTVEKLTAHPEFRTYLDWVANKPATRRYREKRSNKTRKRGRGG